MCRYAHSRPPPQNHRALTMSRGFVVRVVFLFVVLLLYLCLAHVLQIFKQVLFLVEGENMVCRKVRRVQYEPHLVVSKVLNSDLLRTLVHVVYSAKLLVSAGQIAREVSRLLGREYSASYVSVHLRRLDGVW